MQDFMSFKPIRFRRDDTFDAMQSRWSIIITPPSAPPNHGMIFDKPLPYSFQISLSSLLQAQPRIRVNNLLYAFTSLLSRGPP